MRKLVCESPGKLIMAEAPVPVPEEGQVLVRIKKIGICGTDLHAFEGTQPFFSYPRVLGHELGCEITQINADVPGFSIGDEVTFIPYFPCFKCIACRNGKVNCCENIRGAGVHIDGGMADFFVVPSYALIQGYGLNSDQLALVEPMAIGAHAVRITEIKAGEFVLVTGAGPIGLGVMAFANQRGARVIAMDLVDSRLQVSRDYFGAEFILNPMNNPVEAVREITGGDMVTAIIDATGNKRAIEGSLNYLAHGGRITMVGLQREAFSFSHPDFHKRETSLRSSRNATQEDFNLVVESLKSGLVDINPLITHRMMFSELAGNFAKLLDPDQKVVKAIIEL
jgi:2-desacetyl-2-hydroxyethyl bacteriochlorophyllide A dehydrogenase